MIPGILSHVMLDVLLPGNDHGLSRHCSRGFSPLCPLAMVLA